MLDINLTLNKCEVLFQQRQQFFQFADWWAKIGGVAR